MYESLKVVLKRRAETRKAYACHGKHAAYFMPGTGWDKADKNGNRWVETLEGAGLRLKGYADELVTLRHNGWNCDSFQDGTYRGAVLQMPSRHGAAIYLAAYQESYNDGFRVLGNSRGVCMFDDESDAAHAADNFANREVEDARNWDEAWQAGSRYASLKEDIALYRDTAKKLIAEMKAAGRVFPPTICTALRSKLVNLRQAIMRSRAKRDELLEVNDWWRRQYGAAFNDGAGETVFST